jgi:hypothetical protein
LFIPDPGPDFLTIPDPGAKETPDPGSATLLKIGIFKDYDFRPLFLFIVNVSHFFDGVFLERKDSI